MEAVNTKYQSSVNLIKDPKQEMDKIIVKKQRKFTSQKWKLKIRKLYRNNRKRAKELLVCQKGKNMVVHLGRKF